MEINEAIAIFDISIENLKNIKDHEIKKIYRKLALKHHPDKNNNTSESIAYFQKVGMAYDTLLICIETSKSKEYNIYTNSSFIDNFFFNINNFYYKHEGLVKNIIELYNDKIVDYLKNTINSMNNFELQRLKTMIENKNFEKYISNEVKTMIINEIINRNNNIDNSNNIINKNVKTKYLKATINDIIENNVHLMEYNNNRLIIPLWHSELFYELENKIDDIEGINVYIEPDIPENMYLDEFNNLHVYVKKTFSNELLFTEYLEFEIGNKTFNYNMCDIKIEKSQILILKNQGPSVINEYNMYDVSIKSNIIIHLVFV
jgi:hypothetical protein